MSKQKLFIAIHNHKYGASVYPFMFTPTKEKPMPTEDEVISHLDIDFEPDKEEWIEICEGDKIADLDAAIKEEHNACAHNNK